MWTEPARKQGCGGTLQAPPAPNLDGKHDKAAPVGLPAMGLAQGGPVNAASVSGKLAGRNETNVVSTATWVPFKQGGPFATTSRRRSSRQSTGRLMSAGVS